MNFPWMTFVDFGAISAALLIATLIRAKVPFFQRYLIPNALSAGFMLLAFYNYAAPHIGMSQDALGGFAYHLLNISFIAMTLRRPSERSPQRRRRAGSMALGLLSQYAIQATIGLLITFALILTVFPDLFPTIGFLVPLGFSAGPGQAYAIGETWVEYGFTGAGSVGLTFAAVGFLWACFGGVVLMNIGIRRGWVNRENLKSPGGQIRTGVFPEGSEKPVGSRLTTETEALDTMTFNVAVVLAVYLLSFLLLKLITFLLAFAGGPGQDLANSLWGIGFIFCALTSMAVRRIMMKVGVYRILDSGTLTRVAGFSVDMMVAGALGAISIVVVSQYWVPILVMSAVAGVLAFVLLPWMGSRMFPDHQFLRTMIVYGAATGTLATGLALLRVLDPDFESPVAGDYMPAAAIVFALAIPLILMIHLPAYGYRDGNPALYWVSLGICLVYVAFCIVWYTVLSRRKAYARANQLWLSEPAEDDRKVV